jgi:SAM-dependent methyltransferase
VSGGYSGGDSTRYPMWNSTDDEAARLGKLQGLHDEATIRRLRALGVGSGWHCLELGAGAGSVARWMADEVGPTGAVTAVDRDASQLQSLREIPHVSVVEDDLTTMSFPDATFDVIHSRSVLMHVDAADAVVGKLIPALRPGGVVLFEEADGAPAATAVDPPAPFVAIMVPLASRWTWARNLASLLETLGLEDVHDDVRDGPLTGASPVGAFWQHTLQSIRPFLTDAKRMGAAGAAPMDDATMEAMLVLLDDPGFVMPFSLRHNVSGRRPGTGRSPAAS